MIRVIRALGCLVLFIRVTMFIRVTRDMFTVTRVITMICAIKVTCVKKVYYSGLLELEVTVGLLE